LTDHQRRYDKPGLSSRQAASKLLSAIIDKKTSMDGLLDLKGGNPAYLDLTDQDRLLVKAILLSTLRNYQIIEKFLDHLLEKPLPSGAVSLRHILRIGAAQILYLDVPDHSAVDLAVEQANIDPRNRRFANLVNAILRRMAREKDKMLPKLGEKTAMLPDWYAKKLSKSYGFNSARGMMALMSKPAPVDITVKSDADAWAEKLGGTKLTDWSIRLDKLEGPLQSLQGFDDGDWWVQDVAASLPARLFGDLKGKRVIDLCAAPGGKTAQLILAGADVTALDRSKSRLNRLNENLERLKLSAQTEISRMEKYETEDLFDMALLDAPCSSTGTIRRHPDVVWTKDADDIAYLSGVQKGLLEHAITLVKPGGLIVFSNCSLEPDEGEEMVTQFVADNSDQVELLPVDPRHCQGFETAITDEGFVRTTPDFCINENEELQGADGFFAAILLKKQ
jgi:16S rRNA (cytosine967-C5)-methyltransferase